MGSRRWCHLVTIAFIRYRNRDLLRRCRIVNLLISIRRKRIVRSIARPWCRKRWRWNLWMWQRRPWIRIGRWRLSGWRCRWCLCCYWSNYIVYCDLRAWAKLWQTGEVCQRGLLKTCILGLCITLGFGLGTRREVSRLYDRVFRREVSRLYTIRCRFI